MKKLLSFVILYMLCPCFCQAVEVQPLIAVKLPNNMKISIPNDWTILQGERKLVIDKTVKTAIDLSGISELQTTTLLLNAYYPDSKKWASLSVTSERIENATRTTVDLFKESDIQQTEQAVKEMVNSLLAKMGGRTRDWTPMVKVKIGDYVSLKTSYVRESKMEDVRLNSYMFSGDGKIFWLNVSSVLSNEQDMTPTLLAIVRSFHY